MVDWKAVSFAKNCLQTREIAAAICVTWDKLAGYEFASTLCKRSTQGVLSNLPSCICPGTWLATFTRSWTSQRSWACWARLRKQQHWSARMWPCLKTSHVTMCSIFWPVKSVKWPEFLLLRPVSGDCGIYGFSCNSHNWGKRRNEWTPWNISKRPFHRGHIQNNLCHSTPGSKPHKDLALIFVLESPCFLLLLLCHKTSRKANSLQLRTHPWWWPLVAVSFSSKEALKRSLATKLRRHQCLKNILHYTKLKRSDFSEWKEIKRVRLLEILRNSTLQNFPSQCLDSHLITILL